MAKRTGLSLEDKRRDHQRGCFGLTNGSSVLLIKTESLMSKQTGQVPANQANPTAKLTGPSEGDVAIIDELRKLYGRIRAEVGKVIIGQEQVIEQLLICILARGHALLMGVPGLAKTTMVNSLAQVMSLQFNRIQFTPDLMPSDITGTDILQETDQPGRRAFVFVKGPIFANIILA